MLHKANIAVCSEIRTNKISGKNVVFLNVKPAVHKQTANRVLKSRRIRWTRSWTGLVWLGIQTGGGLL